MGINEQNFDQASAFQKQGNFADDLINKYVLSEGEIDEKDADAMYGKYLGYAGAKETEEAKDADTPGVKPGFKRKDAVMLAENDTGTVSDAGDKIQSTSVTLSNSKNNPEAGEGNQNTSNAKAAHGDEEQPEEGLKDEKADSTSAGEKADQLEEYLGALGQREASGKYNVKNSAGYVGKYQMGESALTDTGYMKDGKWTGKDGIHNENDFLNSPEVQDKAIRAFVQKQWKYAKGVGLDQYVGKTINGIKITKSGIIAAVHLKGANGAKPFFETNGEIDPTDGFKTPVSEYIKKMGGFNLPFTEDIVSEKNNNINMSCAMYTTFRLAYVAFLTMFMSMTGFAAGTDSSPTVLHWHVLEESPYKSIVSRLLKQDFDIIRSNDSDPTKNVYVAAVDINDDGRDELFITSDLQPFSGTQGAWIGLYSPTADGKFRKIYYTLITDYSPRILPSTTNGFHDLAVWDMLATYANGAYKLAGYLDPIQAQLGNKNSPDNLLPHIQKRNE